MNVIVVDWSGGSFDQYDQAVANAKKRPGAEKTLLSKNTT
jgi:hypothetical protein